MNLGGQAYEIVRAFSEIGSHRTGTSGDRATSRWLRSELSTHSAEVSLQAFTYHHFDVNLSVRSAGKSIDADALYYSFTGQRNFRNPATNTVDAHACEAEISRDINCKVDAAKAGGHDGLVLATQCPTSDLSGINREYGTDELGFPVVLVAQKDLSTIQTNGADVFFATSCKRSTANNVIAHFPGPPGAKQIVVTTPISGWFRCAGERGCGLSIAIHVAKRLSKSFAVDLLLASGHELGFCGGYHLAKSYDLEPECVLHLGSCIANIDAQMTSVCAAGSPTIERVSDALKRLGTTPTSPADAVEAENWVGESMCWASKNLPMLSIAGQAPYFHACSDLPDVVTNPGLLDNAINAIGDAALALASSEKTETS